MAPPRNGGATIRSVAAAAGVSVATVSRVMAGSDKVTRARREHVQAVAERLGYRPNVMARGLATGTSGMLGVVVPNLSNPYFYDIIRGIGRASAADGYQMVVSDSMEDEKSERSLATELLRFVDGLILIGPREDSDHLDELAGARKPAVMLLGPRESTSLPDLGVDNFAGMSLLYRHLADLGHRTVVYVSGPTAAWQNTRRVEAGRAARDIGVRVRTIEAGGTIEAGYRAADAALAANATAITCFNDLVALGVLSRLTELGVTVPGDVSLTGFDDIAFAAYASPRLTTVSTPREELGRAGWRHLRQVMAGESPTPHELFPAQLVLRESTAAPVRPT